MGMPEIRAFLVHLAVEENVAASTQTQAFSALLFLYRDVLRQELDPLDLESIRARKPKRLPTVLTKAEVQNVLRQMSGVQRLVAQLLYGSGMRSSDSLRLRISSKSAIHNSLRHHRSGSFYALTMRDGYPPARTQYLVGHLTRMCPFLDDGRTPTDRAVSASTGAAQGVTALAVVRASHSPFPTPLKRCRMAGPVVRGGLQPRDDVLRSVWILSRQRAVHDDPLNRLTHVQPRPTQRRIQRHDAMGYQPQHEVGGLVSRQIVQDQQHPQTRQFLRQRKMDRQALLPAFPQLPFAAGLCGTLGRGQLGQHGTQLLLQPRMQHAVGTLCYPFGTQLPILGVKQC